MFYIVRFGHCLWQSCHHYYCYYCLLERRHCLCKSSLVRNGPGWGRFSCLHGRGLERKLKLALLPELADEGQ